MVKFDKSNSCLQVSGTHRFIDINLSMTGECRISGRNLCYHRFCLLSLYKIDKAWNSDWQRFVFCPITTMDQGEFTS